MALGLPEIVIEFRTKGLSAIERSARGIVAILLRDATEGGREISVYNSIIEIDFEHWSEANYGLMKRVFHGCPNKVIVVKVPMAAENYNAALRAIKDLRWNYLVVPDIQDGEVADVAAWIKEQRDEKRKTFKAVLPKIPADHEGIINCTTEHVVVKEGEQFTTLTCAQWCARVAGMLAGLSLARSSTFYAFPEIVEADVPEDPDAAINKGELILIYDQEQYKIGRGVNSLVTFTAEHGEEFRKIKIVEGIDLYMDDIRGTFSSKYVGKVINDYDNKQAFIAAIMVYHKTLQGNVLGRSADNIAAISLEQQRLYLQGKGIDTSEMSAVEILRANTGSKVFLESHVKFVDAMEDLRMTVNL